MKVAITLPTNNPTIYFECFGKTLEYFVPLKDKVSFYVVFQKPNWTEKLIDKAVDKYYELGLSLNYCVREYNWDGVVNMIEVRDAPCSMCRDCDLYFYTDDDVKYNENISCVLEYAIEMFDNKQLGYIQLSDTVHHENKYILIMDGYNGHWTDRGVLVRNVFDSILPDEFMKLKGGWQDILIGHVFASKGYEMKKIYCNVGTHTENKSIEQKGSNVYNWNNGGEGTIVDYINNHKNERYNSVRNSKIMMLNEYKVIL